MTNPDTPGSHPGNGGAFYPSEVEAVARALHRTLYAVVTGHDDCLEWDTMPEAVRAIYRIAGADAIAALSTRPTYADGVEAGIKAAAIRDLEALVAACELEFCSEGTEAIADPEDDNSLGGFDDSTTVSDGLDDAGNLAPGNITFGHIRRARAAATIIKFNATSDKVGLPHRLAALSTRPTYSDGFKTCIVEAYIAGATDVHKYVKAHDEIPRGDPEFTEAAYEYAAAIRSLAEPVGPSVEVGR